MLMMMNVLFQNKYESGRNFYSEKKRIKLGLQEGL